MAGLPDLIRLQAGPFTVDLCPEIGGSIASFTAWGEHVLRPAREAGLRSREPRQMGCYVLVPFSNRVRDARFTFKGRTYQLARNFPPEPNAIHGNGWQRAWTVETATATAARLILDHDPARDGADAWPFPYRATLEFVLADDGLGVRLKLDNFDEPMPAGFGLHPFFPLSAATRLQTRLAGVWLNGADKLPASYEVVPPVWDFRSAAPAAPLTVDNCFTGWAGAACLEWPERDLRLDLEGSAEFANLVIFVPDAHDYFCVEPVTNVNDGFNLAAAGISNTGVVAVEPGDALSGVVRFRPSRLSRA